MKRGLLPFRVMVLLAAVLAGCAPGIAQQDLLKQLENGSPLFLLDVRTEREFRRGHIPGAVNISVFSFREKFEERNLPKTAPIVVICEHGPRASFAGFMLKRGGYRQVYNLEGAMKEWKKNGLPLVQ